MGLRTWKDSFMQPEITSKQRGWMVETQDAGICFVPGDVVAVPDYFKTGSPFELGDIGFDGIQEELSAYIEGRIVSAIEVVYGYFGRVQAPGYLDCSAWMFARSLRELKSELWEYYGPGED